MGHLQLSDYAVQDRQTGEQMMHWDILNKATKFEFSLFNMPQRTIYSRLCTYWLSGRAGR